MKSILFQVYKLFQNFSIDIMSGERRAQYTSARPDGANTTRPIAHPDIIWTASRLEMLEPAKHKASVRDPIEWEELADGDEELRPWSHDGGKWLISDI